jgi:hypothetical protein
MLLFTPGELYDPYYAHAFISSFPKDLVKTAVDQSRKEFVLAKTKGDRLFNRRIPKTLLGISER